MGKVLIWFVIIISTVVLYVDYEGMEENPSNYYDIMAVYMVKHGVGDTATVMNDTSKGWLQAVVNDMCSYTTTSPDQKRAGRMC